MIELCPTVQYTPRNFAHLEGTDRPSFLDEVLRADPSQITYEAVHSEEGGRFLNAESRYMLVETDGPDDPPPGYQWATPAQLTELVKYGHNVNVQGRTLLAVMNAMTARAGADGITVV